jgi:hypothetical protein
LEHSLEIFHEPSLVFVGGSSGENTNPRSGGFHVRTAHAHHGPSNRRLRQVEAALYPTEAMARWFQLARQDYPVAG